MKKRLKKGSHVGVVLSFVIFVTFLVFLYSAVQPVTKMQKEKKAILSYLKSVLLEEFSADLTRVTLRVNDSVNLQEDCITFRDFDIVSITNDPNPEGNLTVKNTSNSILNYSLPGNKLKISSPGAEERFFKIYYSAEISIDSDGVSGNCDKLDAENYSVGLAKTDKYIFRSKVNSTLNEYENSYESLKEKFKIPPGNEFGFRFLDSNRNVILETERKNLTTNVYVEEVPIKFVDENADILTGFIHIEVW